MTAAFCASRRLAPQFTGAAARLSPVAWSELKGASILITGATGFVGKWLLGTLSAASQIHGLAPRICLLTRDPANFISANPELANGAGIELIQGDVTRISSILEGRSFSHVIHAATEASAKLNRENPLQMIDTIVDGTRDLLRLLHRSPPRRLLFVSSGAVYGPQPEHVNHLEENWRGGPDPLGSGSAYHEAKRLAEQMCAAAARTGGLQHVSVARLFAFVGPYLPLDTHFAIGNFIRDALARRPIILTGDGSTVRSYLYAADMAAWTWATLLIGQHCRPYNIGSAQAISTGDLAHLIAGGQQPAIPVEIRGRALPSQPIDRYVPSTARACAELGVAEWTPLAEAIRLTFAHHLSA